MNFSNTILRSEMECINIISATYTLRLIERLYRRNESKKDIDDLYYALLALYNTNNMQEASMKIRELFDMDGMEYPNIIVCLEKKPLFLNIFVNEFIQDFKEVMDEREMEMQR